MHYFAHNYAHSWWPPCLALASARVSNSCCIQIQTRPLFAFLRINNCIEAQFCLTKMVKDMAAAARLFWSLDFNFGFVSSWQFLSGSKSDFIFEVLGRMPNILLSCLSNMLHACIAICIRHPAKLDPPAMIYALNNARLHNVCNQKCISAFSSRNFKPRKHRYLSGFNGFALYNIWDVIFGRVCFMNWQVLSINCNNNLNI